MKTLVLQHIACEPPGLYEDILSEREVTFTRVELDAGERLPDWQDFDAIVAMGGPMSVNDEQALPWLRAEKRLIADAVDAGKPFWGVCLGVQLLASSLGGRVYPGPRPEVGVLPVSLTENAVLDPVFRGAAARLPGPSVARRHLRPAPGSRAPGGIRRLPKPGVQAAQRLWPSVPSRSLE